MLNLILFFEYFFAGAVGGNVPVGAKQLFLSYGREPEVYSFVSKLKQDLEQKGFSVWMDKGDIPAGMAHPRGGMVSK